MLRKTSVCAQIRDVDFKVKLSEGQYEEELKVKDEKELSNHTG